MRPQTMCVSATPAAWEIEQSGGVFVEQLIRPTGLSVPPVIVRPARTQVDELVGEVRQVAAAGYRLVIFHTSNLHSQLLCIPISQVRRVSGRDSPLKARPSSLTHGRVCETSQSKRTGGRTVAA